MTTLLLTLTGFLIIPIAAANAYVGPGPGLSMVGSFFTLLAGVFIALFFVLLYPIRVLLKKRKQKSNPPSE